MFDEIYLKMLFDGDPATDPATDPAEDEEESAIIASQDVEPAISIDHINAIKTGIRRLMEALGVTNLRRIQNGGTVKLYKTTVGDIPAQVGEGEDIPLTKVTRKKVKEITISLKKYRKAVTAEAIQIDGYENAVNDTDRALVNKVRKAVKQSFFANIEDGTGTGTAGADLQAAMANALAALGNKYEDEDVTPLFVLNRDDVYTYLGQAPITTQTLFGFEYLDNFLGGYSAIITGEITAGKAWVTAKENLHGAIPDGASDVAQALGLTTDESGVVLMRHTANTTNASLETLLMSGVTFYAEDLSGVFGVTIGE